MVRLNPNKILKGARKDFEAAWVGTSKQLPRDTKVKIQGPGSTHRLRDAVEQCRQALAGMGFQEYENRTILSVQDVYKQYGPEAPVILDRAFYLATLPRPELGLSDEKISIVTNIVGPFNQGGLQKILRDYKRGEIEGDDFVESLVLGLNTSTEQATAIIEQAFPELKCLRPVATEQTLRSHMTATWYHTLAAMQDRAKFPLAMFAVGPRYRNEQREDKGHLRVHNSASMVVMDPNMSLESGRDIALEFLVKMGFDDANFERKKGTSKYYAHEQEEEVFARWHGEWLEIGDIGMYSPVSLAEFGITSPVFNGGFGVERMAMIFGEDRDIREMVYPQFYSHSYQDTEIADALALIREPRTERGKQIAEGIERIAREHATDEAPVRFVAYEDENVKVEVFEDEEGQRLLGPAALNNVYVENGNILSTPGTVENVAANYLNSSAQGIAARIEENICGDASSGEYRVRMVKGMSDVNLTLPPAIHQAITGDHKRMQIGGPMFLNVKYITKGCDCFSKPGQED